MPNSPDDICEVCGERRDEHGDMRHKFSEDGVLMEVEPPKPPRSLPPQVRGGSNPQQDAFLRLIETLAAKNLIGGDDMLYIFGGIRRAPDRGQAEGGAEAGYRTPTT